MTGGASTELGEPVPKTGDAHSREGPLFERVGRLSDGVFAISLTLLVLNFEVPETGDGLWDGLVDSVPTAIAFVVTVFVVALFWRNHHALFSEFQALDWPLVGANFVYLGLIALVPFPNELLGAFPDEPLSFVAFAALLAALATVETAMHLYATRRGLLAPEISPATARLELYRGVLTIAVFVTSIPLAFVLVELTPVLWVGLVAVDSVLLRLAE